MSEHPLRDYHDAAQRPYRTTATTASGADKQFGGPIKAANAHTPDGMRNET